MNVIFSARGWADYLYWQSEDRRTLKRVNLLIEDIRRNGHDGIGKPEPLKHDLAGAWSRRIDHRHRLVYRLTDDAVEVAACRFHYGN